MAQPTPSYIQLPPNSTGPLVDNVVLTVSSNQVNRQNTETATPVNPTASTFTETVNGNSTGTAFTCPLVSAGLTGYLAKAVLFSTGDCQWTIKAGSNTIAYAGSGDGEADFSPAHRFYLTCPAGSAFSLVPTNLTDSEITVWATVFWDQF